MNPQKTGHGPIFFRRLRDQFRTDPAQLPTLEQPFAEYERPNLHLAIEEIMGAPESEPSLSGIVTLQDYQTISLPKLAQTMTSGGYAAGPVEYVDVPLPGGRMLACIKRGLYLFGPKDRPAALLVTTNAHPFMPGIEVGVMAADRETAEGILRDLARRVKQGQAYRGHVLSLEQNCHGQLTVEHHQLPAVGREQLILPEDLLKRIERHTLTFTRHAKRLKAAGRHLKRGILLHGPPGTGKTLTAMYLAARMPGRTVLLITGGGAGFIEAACKMARLLEPATIILEDVDLIGTMREHQTVNANALLFELLNQMDGLAEDVDIMFILTSNRPDVLEPALAARPGRIDQAIEIPSPDSGCRRRLIDLYARGLNFELANADRLIERINGVSGAFIKEMLRKAAVYAAEDGDGELIVRDRHVDEALGDLLVAGGPLTKSLLGAV